MTPIERLQLLHDELPELNVEVAQARLMDIIDGMSIARREIEASLRLPEAQDDAIMRGHDITNGR